MEENKGDTHHIEIEDEMLTTALPRNRMLTLNEAADHLGLHPDTLRQQAGRGVLKAMKVGRDWLVSPIEVERYANYHKRLR
jgi:excisionase family DNA binding protein